MLWELIARILNRLTLKTRFYGWLKPTQVHRNVLTAPFLGICCSCTALWTGVDLVGLRSSSSGWFNISQNSLHDTAACHGTLCVTHALLSVSNGGLRPCSHTQCREAAVANSSMGIPSPLQVDVAVHVCSTSSSASDCCHCHGLSRLLLTLNTMKLLCECPNLMPL